MALWKVAPTWKKSIVERATWMDESRKKFIINEIGWRWGEFTIQTEGDDPPIIDEDTDLFAADFEVVDFSTNDGCWEDNDYEGEWTDEEKEAMEERLSGGEIAVYELEEEGWLNEECELYITCEVEITKVEK